MRRGKAKGERKKQRAREATKKRVSDQRRRDNSPSRVLRQASVWCACGCEQRRQQVRHGSITNNTRVETRNGRSRCPPDFDWHARLPRERVHGKAGCWLATDMTRTHTFSGRFHFTDDFLVSETILPLPSP